MLVEDKNHRVELEQKVQDANDRVFSQHGDRLHRVVSFGGTEKFRFDRKMQVGVSAFITEKKH